MEYLAFAFFGWFIIIFMLLMICPTNRKPLITKFFERVLPRLPLTGIIKAIKSKYKP